MSSVGGRTNDVTAELEGPEETTATENRNDAETTTNTSQEQATTPSELSVKGILETQQEDKAAENKVDDSRVQRQQERQATPYPCFEVDTTLEHRSRIGRGTRPSRFGEEFGYETLVSEQEPHVMWVIYSYTTIVGASFDHRCLQPRHHVLPSGDEAR
jgi:hypothetical protein